MESLMKYQTRDGYFNGDIVGTVYDNISKNITNQNALNKHTTGTAVASFANVIRYILETHY